MPKPKTVVHLVGGSVKIFRESVRSEETLSYSYDQVGNRLSEVVNGTGTTYSYGSYNKLLSAGSTTYTYDNNGNTVSKTAGANAWSYKYDYENRLKQVQLNGQNVLQASYDGDGRRIQTVAGDTTVYHYLAGSWDPAYVKDLSTGVTTDIVFAGGFRVGKVQGGVNYYYHLDLLGSVRLVTQTPNLQTFTAKYLPYGNLYATSGVENFQYTGKQLDVSTGLTYYGYRYLDSQSGRFMTVDPAQPNYMNPQTLNQYIYALDNPNLYVDQTGAGSDLPYGVDWYSKRYASKELLAEEGLEINAHLTPGEAERALKAGISEADLLGDNGTPNDVSAALMNYVVFGRMFPNLTVHVQSPDTAPNVAYASVTDTTTGTTTIEVTPMPNAPVTQATVTAASTTNTIATGQSFSCFAQNYAAINAIRAAAAFEWSVMYATAPELILMGPH